MKRYSISEVSALCHISKRTLRYYDQTGLLCAKRESNHYRYYTEEDMDLLQQILFYKEMGLGLMHIQKIIHSKAYNKTDALLSHLKHLKEEKIRVEKLILTVEKSIKAMKGELYMQTNEKFEGFKKEMLEENEKKYGSEIREKYGEEAAEESNRKIEKMSLSKFNRTKELSKEIAILLKKASEEKDNMALMEACEKHKEWLCLFWKEGTYSPLSHRMIADTYVEDERFKKYYDKIVPDGAALLRNGIYQYTEQAKK